jgi:hypothetical protein
MKYILLAWHKNGHRRILTGEDERSVSRVMWLDHMSSLISNADGHLNRYHFESRSISRKQSHMKPYISTYTTRYIEKAEDSSSEDVRIFDYTCAADERGV